LSLKVLKLPFPATLQDLGRTGWLRFGVPCGGAFDFESLIAANRALGNDGGAPGVEITLLGGVFEAVRSMTVSVAGAESAIVVNGKEIGTCSRCYPVPASLTAGDRLEICPAQTGLRAYLCTPGGFTGHLVLGSVSGQTVKAGDSLEPGQSSARPDRSQEPMNDSGPVGLIPGPHATEHDLLTITSTIYTATNHSNRVGIRLDGPTLTPQADRPSEPACIGAIQISNNGQPIILGPDGPTIGGYPIVAVVKKADQSRLGQLRPGDEIRFELS